MSLFKNILPLSHSVESAIDAKMLGIVVLMRYLFISIMIVYLGVCLVSLSEKLILLTHAQGGLDFASIKTLLTDSLFVLIVLAIIRTLFIRSGFDYAVSFLEIAFVVIVRKLILIETTPEETWILFVLGLISSIFLLLIVYGNYVRRRWAFEDKQATNEPDVT